MSELLRKLRAGGAHAYQAVAALGFVLFFILYEFLLVFPSTYAKALYVLAFALVSYGCLMLYSKAMEMAVKARPTAQALAAERALLLTALEMAQARGAPREYTERLRELAENLEKSIVREAGW